MSVTYVFPLKDVGFQVSALASEMWAPRGYWCCERCLLSLTCLHHLRVAKAEGL